MKIISKIAELSEVPILRHLILVESFIAVLASLPAMYAVALLLCFATDSPQANNLPTYALLFAIFCLFLLYFWAKLVVLVVLFKRIFTQNRNPSFMKSFEPLFAFELIASAILYIPLFFFFIDL